MKILPFSRKPTKTTQFLQDHGHSLHMWWSGHNWRSGVTGRSPEVKCGHSPFFSPISRDWMEIETRKWCQTTWLVNPLRKMCIMTYLGHDLTLTWPGLRSILKLILQCQKVHIWNRLDEANTMVSFFSVSLISKKEKQSTNWPFVINMHICPIAKNAMLFRVFLIFLIQKLLAKQWSHWKVTFLVWSTLERSKCNLK